MRLFAAVQPPPAALDHLENALAVVRGTGGGPGGGTGGGHGGGLAGRPSGGGRSAGRGGAAGGLRWTPPEDRHVTVAFYGEVPEGYLDEVAAGLDDVAAAHRQFETALRGAGLFDGRTLWVGCAGEEWTPLMADAGRLGAELLGRIEDRRSRPHLTVARSRGGRGARGRAGTGVAGVDPAALAHALALYTGPAWTVAEVALVSSRLGAGPAGTPLHEIVHRSPLGPVAG